MPRPNKTREVYAEGYLADRIASEREARSWSLEGLAKRMTDAGCAINQSAIYKIEQGKPRRRITVDELVAFSRVFAISLDDLLTDPELWQARQIAPLLEEWRLNTMRYNEVVRDITRRNEQIEALVREAAAESGIAKGTIRKYWSDTMPAGSTWAPRLAGIFTGEDD